MSVKEQTEETRSLDSISDEELEEIMDEVEAELETFYDHSVDGDGFLFGGFDHRRRLGVDILDDAEEG